MARCIIQVGVLFALIAQAAGDNLLLVQAIWRHGDRSPTTTFPTDVNTEDKWPQGWGQLTTLGMQQHYSLGSRLRTMYGDFISSTYKAEEIYVRSTDIDRTLMSAMSNLAGFYQNGTVDVDFPDTTNVPNWPTLWSPIPVHTVDYATDLIGYPFAECARADQLYEEIQQSPSYLNVSAENQALFDWLTNVTGVTDPVTLDNLWLVYDALTIEKIHNMSLPSWYNDTIYNHTVAANDYADDFLFGIVQPPVCELIKLRGGSLLKAITDRMTAKVTCMRNASSSSDCTALNKLKYYVYSARVL
uniref:Acid phosphatase n=1 Tax=Plectus sambesii TaxID=2011161 RepID=A0A914VRA9_9BILA